MVGVPRSRGCIGCRQQKKKCTVTLTPPCPRCKRLNISCVGYGERRLKFQDESQRFVNRNTVTASPKPSHNLPQSTGDHQNECRVQWAPMISTNPTSILTALIASFTHSIDGKGTDTGHHLAWNFGDFLYDVPRCLGFNESLDAAADALVAGYDHFRRTSYTAASVICLRKYSQALKSLGKCLSTVEVACEPATLCAIMIIMMVEVLIGISNSSIKHAGGAASILKYRGTRPPKDELERKLLMALRGPVVVQAFFLDESYYTAAEWTSLVSGYSLAGDGADEGFFAGMAATANLFQRTRTLLSQDLVSQEETERLTSCAFALHQTLKKRVSDLSERLDGARGLWVMGMHTTEAKFAHGFCARDYGLALSTQIVVNCILAALQREWYDSAKGENIRLCQEIFNLGEREAIYHRPLGSSWMLIALPVASIGASSAQDKKRVAKLVADYTHGYSGEATDVQTIEMERLAIYLSCSDLTL